jgi:hypothetical protein
MQQRVREQGTLYQGRMAPHPTTCMQQDVCRQACSNA